MASILPRFFIVCALGVLLTACTNAVTGNISIFEGPPRLQKDRALVIVGLSGLPHQVVPSATMLWEHEDASGWTLSHMIGAGRHCNAGGAIWCEKPTTTYHISSVVPGTYTLKSVQRTRAMRFHKTKYYGKPPSVTVKAGEIVYIGDYIFDFSDDPIRPHGIVFRPQAARQELMKQSKGNPGGDMMIRRPTFTNVPQKSANEPR